MSPGVRLALYIRVGWGLIVLFGLCGMLVGKAAALTVLLVSASVWTITRIVIEAADALMALRRPPGPLSTDAGGKPRSSAPK